MSFRNRLTLFFVVIVIVPMLAVAVILYLLIADSVNNRTSSSLGASQSAAIGLYQADENGPRTRAAVQRIVGDPVLIPALVQRDRRLAQRQAQFLVMQDHIVRLAVFKNGKAVIDAGDPNAVAPNRRPIETPTHRFLGTLELSLRTPGAYARNASRVTGVDLAVTSGSTILAASDKSGQPAGGARLAQALTGRAGELVQGRDVTIDGSPYRVAAFGPLSFDDRPVQVELLLQSDVGATIDQSRLLVGTVLGGFLALALAFALLVSRSLQRRLVSFLEAARRFGAGEFGTRVPVVGRDEFAALGDEFNSMASQL
ncbi:MAG: hypothetical protein QOG06_2500, partial [Gaiellaceae bacterium]|nr:hypothetical protein [Gaiellaceae bacterium]